MLESGKPFVKTSDSAQQKPKVIPSKNKTHAVLKPKVIPDENKTYSEDSRRCRIVPGKSATPEDSEPAEGGLTTAGELPTKIVPPHEKTEEKIYS